MSLSAPSNSRFSGTCQRQTSPLKQAFLGSPTLADVDQVSEDFFFSAIAGCGGSIAATLPCLGPFP